jgi:hypothetical protein
VHGSRAIECLGEFVGVRSGADVCVLVSRHPDLVLCTRGSDVALQVCLDAMP